MVNNAAERNVKLHSDYAAILIDIDGGTDGGTPTFFQGGPNLRVCFYNVATA